MAERVGFEPTVGCPITSFQDWLLKPLGHLSIAVNYNIPKEDCQVFTLPVTGRKNPPESGGFWRSERDLNPRAAFDRLLP